LSEEALRRTGYFDAEAVRTWRQRYKGLRAGSLKRVSIEMGLVGVLATQLWHQTFIDGSLADVPGKVASGQWLVASHRPRSLPVASH
jgi:asparagine synthase (glutamine-hydrolysing)